jgi:flagellar protein FliJ
MKEQKSKLQNVLKVKKFREKKAQGELVQIQAACEVEKSALTDLNQRKESAMDAASRTVKVRATELQTNQAFIQNLAKQIQKQEEKIETIRQKEDQKREELTGKSQERKMVEKLDEKRRTDLAKERERKEQRLLDVLSRKLNLLM